MRRTLLILIVATALISVSETSHAYIGPGAGITAVGTFIALVGAVLFAIVGFVWYPVKRLRQKLQTTKSPDELAQHESADADEEDLTTESTSTSD